MFLLSLLLRWLLLAAAVALAAWVTPDVTFEGGLLSALWVALLIALANVLVGLVMRVLPTPSAFLLTAALTLAVNGLAVWLASAFTDALEVDGFLPAVGFALMVSIFSMVLVALAVRLLPDARGSADAGRR